MMGVWQSFGCKLIECFDKFRVITLLFSEPHLLAFKVFDMPKKIVLLC